MSRTFNDSPKPVSQDITHTFLGMPYYSDSFLCLQCKLWFCPKCQSTHSSLHRERVRIQLRRWAENTSEFKYSADCTACSTPGRARLQCGFENCHYCLCISCFHKSIVLQKFLEDHTKANKSHKMLYAIFPDHWQVTQSWRTSPCTCLAPRPAAKAVIYHCERCHTRKLRISLGEGGVAMPC
jgi:hypothetical protein